MGWLLVALGVVVTAVALAGMLDAIAVSVGGGSRSGVPSFIWFIVGVGAILAGRAAIGEALR